MFNLVLGLIINFGDNTYENSGSNEFLTELVIATVSSLFSVAIAYFIFWLSQKRERDKEVGRLGDVRRILYYFLAHQRDAILSQIESLTKAIEKTTEDLKPPGKCDLVKFNINTDIYSPQLQSLHLDDLFKIIVASKEDHKERRQYLFTSIYHCNSLADKVLIQMQEMLVQHIEEMKHRQNTAQGSVNALADKLNAIVYAEEISSEVQKDYVTKLTKIHNDNLNSPPQELDTIYSRLILPVKRLSIEFDELHDADEVTELVDLIEDGRLSLLAQKSDFRQQCTNWKLALAQCVKTIHDTIVIEYK